MVYDEPYSRLIVEECQSAVEVEKQRQVCLRGDENAIGLEGD